MSGYCDGCGNTLCTCKWDICRTCGEKGHFVCGIIGKDSRDEKIIELEAQLELKDSWVKHHQKSVEIAVAERHGATDKVKELEKKLAEAVELINKIKTDESGDWDFIQFLIKEYEKIKAK